MSGLGSVGDLRTARTLGDRANEWRASKNYSCDPGMVGFKLLEEAGEFARACIGELEHRTGRGDVEQEAAQTVIVVAALLHLLRPGVHIMDLVEAEMNRCGAPGD